MAWRIAEVASLIIRVRVYDEHGKSEIVPEGYEWKVTAVRTRKGTYIARSFATVRATEVECVLKAALSLMLKWICS